MLALHIHDRWSALGGADWYLLSIMDAYREHIRSAGLFGRADGTAPARYAPSDGLELIKKLDRKSSFSGERRMADFAARRIKEINPDVIHVHNILNPHLLRVLAGLGPVLMTVQDHRFFCPGRGKVQADGTRCDQLFGLACAGCFQDEDYFFRLLELVRARLDALAEFPALTVLSEYMKAELAKAGLDAARIHVIPPFAHGLAGTPRPAAFRQEILFAGRIVWAKGVFDLLDALPRIDPRFGLVIAGRGPSESEARDRVIDLGLDGRVAFRGWVPHQDLAPLYARAKLVVMPSRWQEPFGIAGLEAQFLGRPVVAYDVGGIGEWLADRRTGLLAPPGDIPALAAAVNTLLDCPDQATELGLAGRERAGRHFDRTVLTDRLIGLYRQVAGH